MGVCKGKCIFLGIFGENKSKGECTSNKERENNKCLFLRDLTIFVTHIEQ